MMLKGRISYPVEKCKNRRVLHIGCCGDGKPDPVIYAGKLLHHEVSKVAKELHGIDIDRAGLQFLSEQGFKNLHYGDAEHLDPGLGTGWDVVLVCELLEHLSNPGLFLESLKGLLNQDTIIIFSCPNSVKIRLKETVHPDHNCYYSPKTLRQFLGKHGYTVIEMCGYAFYPYYYVDSYLAADGIMCLARLK
jgi:2-polyprenyl-3-methyl-5-hydroxy-6-metoxy-1,4-benzoquinol methylase